MTMSLKEQRAGFTLVELAIVLVIIGLLVGGVLVGQDLIKAAEIRAVSSDIERFNTGAAAFRTKYGGVPGDLLSSRASTFGLAAGAGTDGLGDGDGILENNTTTKSGLGGENALFWTHLSQAQFIPFGLTGNTNGAEVDNDPALTNTQLQAYLPQLRIRDLGFIHAYGSGGLNYYMIADFSTVGTANGAMTATDVLSPREALGIDEKLDDGQPAQGVVLSFTGALASASAPSGGAATNAEGVCYDNDTAPYAYATNTEAIANSLGCALRIRGGF